MKNYKNLILSFFLLFFSSCAQEVLKRTTDGKMPRSFPRKVFSGVKKKVALMTFFNESPYQGNDLGVTATEELRRELSRTGEFIIDPMSQKIFGSSREIYAGGGMKLVQLARKARAEGVNLVIFGRVIEARLREKVDEIGIVRETKSYSEALIEVKIFDVNSNKEIFSDKISGQADDRTYQFFMGNREEHMSYRRELLRYSVQVATRKVIPFILDLSSRMNWVGRVAKILGSKIYLNAGRKSGLHLGDVLKVMTEGHEVFDPETGALIGTSKGEIKGTIEVIDYFGPDGAMAILHSGGAVVEGDFVQLY